jgi:hypothetical protein
MLRLSARSTAASTHRGRAPSRQPAAPGRSWLRGQVAQPPSATPAASTRPHSSSPGTTSKTTRPSGRCSLASLCRAPNVPFCLNAGGDSVRACNEHVLVRLTELAVHSQSEVLVIPNSAAQPVTTSDCVAIYGLRPRARSMGNRERWLVILEPTHVWSQLPRLIRYLPGQSQRRRGRKRMTLGGSASTFSKSGQSGWRSSSS